MNNHTIETDQQRLGVENTPNLLIMKEISEKFDQYKTNTIAYQNVRVM